MSDPAAPDLLAQGLTPAVAAGRVRDARAELVRIDPALARIDGRVPAFGWRTRPAGFAALVYMIIGQQVSTASAEAVWTRLSAALGAVTTESVSGAGEEVFRTAGFSRQKTRYVRLIAAAALDFEGLRALDDEAATATLTALTGVGRWTAECYLLMSEGRLDVFPSGDIALQEAIRWLDALDARPDAATTAVRAQSWRPYRGVAAHLLWAWYTVVKSGAAQR